MTSNELVGPVAPRVSEGTAQELERYRVRRDLALPARRSLVPAQRIAVPARVALPRRRRLDRTTRRVITVFAAGMPTAGIGGLVFELLTGSLLLAVFIGVGAAIVVVFALLSLLGGGGGGFTCAGVHCSGCSNH